MVTISEIRRIQMKKQERQNECFNIILDQCLKKIDRTVVIHQTYCIFEVPEFIFGYGLYDINHCIVYLMRHLKQKGFNVHYLFPKYIRVDWSQEDANAPEYTLSFNNNAYLTNNLVKTPDIMKLTIPNTMRPNQPQLMYDNSVNNTMNIKNKNISVVQNKRDKNNIFLKPITDLKPSGRFVLNFK